MREGKMIILAILISLAPGLVGLFTDPDMLGIAIFVIHALLVYVAWRSHFIGGILLIVLAALWLGLFVYNVTLGPMSVANIFQWLGFMACPLVGGILFIRLEKKK
jgi:hypothetical protein